MFKKFIYSLFLVTVAFMTVNAQAVQNNADTIMVLPFENKAELDNKAEFNWVGESFASSLTELLSKRGLNVVSNQERKIFQQSIDVPLSTIPSLASSIKIAQKADATLLVLGSYKISPEVDDVAASLVVTAKIIRVKEGRVLSEDFADGRRVEFNVSDALGNLQTIQGQLAWAILFRIDKVLYKLDQAFPFSEEDLRKAANKIPSTAFEAFIKGLLSRDNAEVREIYFKNALRIFAEERSGKIYPEAALELGHLYMNQGKESQAIEYFSRVPEDSPLYLEAAFYTGLIQWEKRNYEQALAVLSPLADDLKLTMVYNTLGAIAVEASRREKDEKKAAKLLNDGLEFIKRAVDSEPENAMVQFNYGFALFLNENYKDAIPQLLGVVGKNQTDGEAYFLLAKSFEKIGDKGRATNADDSAKKYLTQNNRYAKLQVDWENKKDFEIQMRVEKLGRKAFVSVVTDRKDTATTQNYLNETETFLAQAEKFYREGNDDEATSVLQKVLVSEPMSAKAYLLLGKIHLRRGDLERATSSFKTALFWDNNLIDAHITLGKIFLEKDECLQAKNYAASAMALDPENQEATGLNRQVERCSK